MMTNIDLFNKAKDAMPKGKTATMSVLGGEIIELPKRDDYPMPEKSWYDPKNFIKKDDIIAALQFCGDKLDEIIEAYPLCDYYGWHEISVKGKNIFVNELVIYLAYHVMPKYFKNEIAEFDETP